MQPKPPPPGDSIGWRVEFRKHGDSVDGFRECGVCDFYCIADEGDFCHGLNFYIPIDKVDENMYTAHARYAICTKKLWFRKDIFLPLHQYVHFSTSTDPSATPIPPPPSRRRRIHLFTINEIINGVPPKP
ncbi:glutamate-cysteine ligase catalytic subunit [Terfezia claveryi]|nr:glutamate-cysteine ligase catalytic subunit [Terfezia claveryi]